MSAALRHPVGPFTIADWNALPPRPDGSRLELLWGNFLVSPPPTAHHQYFGYRLCTVLEAALNQARRTDLYVLPAAGTQLPVTDRNALIPDIMVINTKPVGKLILSENLLLAVEIWSPGNRRQERVDKEAAFAAAGVPHFWTVEQDRFGVVQSVTAHRLSGNSYVEEGVARPGGVTTFKIDDVPVSFDPATLMP